MKNLFVPTGETRGTGSWWYYEIISQDDEFVHVKLFDYAYAENQALPYRDFDALVIRYGLWKKTGLYQFDRADDPAINDIAFATRYPQAAGTELHNLRQKLKDLEGKP